MNYLCQFGQNLVKIWSLVRKIEYRQAFFFIYVPGDLVNINKVEVTKLLLFVLAVPDKYLCKFL